MVEMKKDTLCSFGDKIASGEIGEGFIYYEYSPDLFTFNRKYFSCFIVRINEDRKIKQLFKGLDWQIDNGPNKSFNFDNIKINWIKVEKEEIFGIIGEELYGEWTISMIL